MRRGPVSATAPARSTAGSPTIRTRVGQLGERLGRDLGEVVGVHPDDGRRVGGAEGQRPADGVQDGGVGERQLAAEQVLDAG